MWYEKNLIKNWRNILLKCNQKKKKIVEKSRKMFKRTNQIRVTVTSVVAVLALINVQLCFGDTSSNLTTVPPTISDLNIIKNVMSDYTETPTTSSSVKKEKPLYSTGNELWDNLIRDCLKKPSFSCIQKNVFTFLDTTLNLNDVNVTSRVQLTRNKLQYEIPESPKDEENEIHFEGRGKLRSQQV